MVRLVYLSQKGVIMDTLRGLRRVDEVYYGRVQETITQLLFAQALRNAVERRIIIDLEPEFLYTLRPKKINNPTY